MERIWHGIWIKAEPGYSSVRKELTPSPYFRTTFEATGHEQEAMIYLCGLGLHELIVNGQKVGDGWYTPALSQYDRRVSYNEYDLRGMLKAGTNVLVVHLGNGFYNCKNNWEYTVNLSSWRGMPRLICDVVLDGRTVEASGVHWKVHASPITFDCHHEGEDYDARLEMPECFSADYDASGWRPALRAISPGGIVEREEIEPRRILRRIAPVSCQCLEANCRVFDFGVNVSGVVEIAVSGRRGTVVRLRYSEMLTADGHADTRNVDVGQRGARYDTDSYTLKGDGMERWHPRFVWHGFQYAEVTTSDPEMQLHSIHSLFIGSDLQTRGAFHSSHPILNRLQELTLTSYRSNFMGIPTDCPTREKFGWTGDSGIAQETGWWNFNPARGLARLVDLILDLQRPDGVLSTHGPTSIYGYEECSPSFSFFHFDYCQNLLDFLGDDSAIRKYYPALRKAVGFFDAMTRDEPLYHFGYGDWTNPLTRSGGDGYPTSFDPTMLESAYLVHILDRMAAFADYLQETADAVRFRSRAREIAACIHARFYDAESGLYDKGNAFRAGTAIALYYGIAPEESRRRSLDALVSQVRQERHRVLDGIQGARLVPRALAENGYAADAFEMLVQQEYPGWGNWIARGATSLWENWRGTTSRNHIMFGDVSAWMYRYLAGFSPLAPGFRRVRIQPCFVPQLQEVSCEHATPLGRLAIAWHREGTRIHCDLELPAGAVAEVRLPGRPVQEATGKASYTLEA